MSTINQQTESLPADIQATTLELASRWSDADALRRLWARDSSLWTSGNEAQWLGWLTVASEQAADLSELDQFSRDVRRRFDHAVLLGMGGSSLCPEVLGACFGRIGEFPPLQVLDSTDPGQIRDCMESIRIGSTLFMSASKSGSTLETALLTDYCLEQVASRVGPQTAGSQFVAITDPGSALDSSALKLRFWRVFHGKPSIGGRYSALSAFGLVPAAAMGLSVSRILAGACAMQESCGPSAAAEENPGLRLGLVLGAAAIAGRDKLCLLCSPGIAPLGAWIEQLVAESTGKLARGILPVDGTSSLPSDHAPDRVFARIELASESDPAADSAVDQLQAAGHPVVRIRVRDLAELGQEFFRWEFATAVAGSVLGLNPFDQPDVESSKLATKEVTAAYESAGVLPAPEPWLESEWARLYASPALLGADESPCSPASVPEALRALVATIRDRDYFALLAYINRGRETSGLADSIRARISSKTKAAATVGFGPRFLHSTGQLHKGGPNTGVFLQVATTDGPHLEIPGRDLHFGVVKGAQSIGDFEVLSRLGRRAMRLEVGGEPGPALQRLDAALAEALQ